MIVEGGAELRSGVLLLSRKTSLVQKGLCCEQYAEIYVACHRRY